MALERQITVYVVELLKFSEECMKRFIALFAVLSVLFTFASNAISIYAQEGNNQRENLWRQAKQYISQNDYVQAEKVAKVALNLPKGTGADEATSHEVLSEVYLAKEDYKKAGGSLKIASKIRVSIVRKGSVMTYRDDARNCARTLNRLGGVLINLKKYRDARLNIMRAMDLYKTASGTKTELREVYKNMASYYRALGENGAASMIELNFLQPEPEEKN